MQSLAALGGISLGYHEVPLGRTPLASTSFTRQRCVKTPLFGAGNARASNTYHIA